MDWQQSGSDHNYNLVIIVVNNYVAQGTVLGYTTFYTGSSDTLTKLKGSHQQDQISAINAVELMTQLFLLIH